jgi:SNF2 family DNA or RNA helicase
MDLVGRHLDEANIKYLRIDGNTLMSERQRRLDKFDKDLDAHVLLR